MATSGQWRATVRQGGFTARIFCIPAASFGKHWQREESIQLIYTANATERHRVAQLYQQLGLNVQSCESVEHAARFQFWHPLATNQLKVFASLSTFLEEYRIREERLQLLLCQRHQHSLWITLVSPQLSGAAGLLWGTWA